MHIINTGLFYFGTDGTAYRGKIKVTKKHLQKIVKQYIKSKHYKREPWSFKKDPLTMEGQYSLGVTFTDYLVSKLTNTSRYNYKRQNYIIQIIK